MSSEKKEETLDPVNWDKFKALGYRVLEDALTHLQNIRDYPNEHQPEEALPKLLVSLSEEGEGEEQVCNSVLENLIPYSVSNTRPQFWGFVAGTGSPYGVLVDTLISSRNAGKMYMGDLSICKQAINWIKELLEVPEEYSGVFVSGGSEANYTGLAVARNAKAEVDMKTQ